MNKCAEKPQDVLRVQRIRQSTVEVIADGLTFWEGAQFAIDTTFVSVLRGDGSARPRAADHNGAASEAARRRKEGIYPEFARGTEGSARLVVLAAEVGGGRPRRPNSCAGWQRHGWSP